MILWFGMRDLEAGFGRATVERLFVKSYEFGSINPGIVSKISR